MGVFIWVSYINMGKCVPLIEKMWNITPYRGFSVKKIFFGRKIPRVEPGRASIHGTYVPWMDGEQVTDKLFKRTENK